MQSHLGNQARPIDLEQIFTLTYRLMEKQLSVDRNDVTHSLAVMMTIAAEAQRRIDRNEPVTLELRRQNSLRMIIDALLVSLKSLGNQIEDLIRLDFDQTINFISFQLQGYNGLELDKIQQKPNALLDMLKLLTLCMKHDKPMPINLKDIILALSSIDLSQDELSKLCLTALMLNFRQNKGRGLGQILCNFKFGSDCHSIRNALFTALFDFVTDTQIDESEQSRLQEIVFQAVQMIGDYKVIEKALGLFDQEEDGLLYRI